MKCPDCGNDDEGSGLEIGVAKPEDSAALLEIYSPYVEKTAITFEYTIPTEKDFAKRISVTLREYPYLVARINGRIAGYAYAGLFKERAAYSWSVETSVYVREDMRRLGIGRELYNMLEKILRVQGILNLNACIACTDCERDVGSASSDSEKFHKRLGYRRVGRFHKCGYKFGRWYDIIWMEKHIGRHGKNQPRIKKFSEIREFIKADYGII